MRISPCLTTRWLTGMIVGICPIASIRTVDSWTVCTLTGPITHQVTIPGPAIVPPPIVCRPRTAVNPRLATDAPCHPVRASCNPKRPQPFASGQDEVQGRGGRVSTQQSRGRRRRVHEVKQFGLPSRSALRPGPLRGPGLEGVPQVCEMSRSSRCGSPRFCSSCSSTVCLCFSSSFSSSFSFCVSVGSSSSSSSMNMARRLPRGRSGRRRVSALAGIVRRVPQEAEVRGAASTRRARRRRRRRDVPVALPAPGPCPVPRPVLVFFPSSRASCAPGPRGGGVLRAKGERTKSSEGEEIARARPRAGVTQPRGRARGRIPLPNHPVDTP